MLTHGSHLAGRRMRRSTGARGLPSRIRVARHGRGGYRSRGSHSTRVRLGRSTSVLIQAGGRQLVEWRGMASGLAGARPRQQRPGLPAARMERPGIEGASREAQRDLVVKDLSLIHI
eukprot:4691648-Heterocapsa_arctica.AAC.1